MLETDTGGVVLQLPLKISSFPKTDRASFPKTDRGIRYPTLPAMLNHDAMLIRISVSCIPCYHRLYHVILGYPILQMGYPDCWTLVQSTGPNLSCSVKLDLDLLKPWRVSTAAAAPNDQAVRAFP